MCGIVGIVAARSGMLPPDAVIHAMNDAIRHRGPDDAGHYRDDQALIGMRRLAIIDLATGHQPMQDESGKIHLVFNGEIYNYRELRAQLQASGHVFRTQSDSEVILRGYIEFGVECFAKLNGMFAVALWDARRRQLVLGRDRFGEKPLFYSERESRLIFASELKALIEVPGFDRRIDAASVASYATFGYVPGPGSIFAGVRKLPPAHYLVYADGRTSLHRYWSLDPTVKTTLTGRDAEDALAEKLDAAVSSRLVSDVPFGAFLSGGLDSSVVVALMSRHLSMPVQTFSIGFKEAAFNELSDARRVANHLGTDHHELVVEPDAVALLEQLVWYLDEPFADASAVPTFLVAQLARTHVKMALTGDGGDEAFAGYDRYLRYLKLQQLGAARKPASLAAAAIGPLLPGELGHRVRRVGRRLAESFPQSYLSGVALSSPELVRELLPRAAPGEAYAGLALDREALGRLGDLDRIVAIDFASYLPDDILVKLDRMAMANSLEGRSPLLDHRLVEFAVSLPASLRVHGGRGKHLLRKVAARWLPADVLAKPKQGFGIPLAEWFRGPLRELASDTIESRPFRERGFFDVAVARRCLSTHLARQADMSETLWLLMSFELWCRRFIDGAATVPTIAAALTA